MQPMIRQDGGGSGYVNIPTVVEPAHHHHAPGLLEVMWRRRWTFALTLLACLAGAAVYLTLATPIYLASARVALEQNAPKAFSEQQGFVQGSEGFLPTEADALLSMPVLKGAMEHVAHRSMKTFAG